jgi:hypothetical protein
MTSVADRLQVYFDVNGVAYRIIEHEPAASAEEYHAFARAERTAMTGQ